MGNLAKSGDNEGMLKAQKSEERYDGDELCRARAVE